jgi:hypothetical protein
MGRSRPQGPDHHHTRRPPQARRSEAPSSTPPRPAGYALSSEIRYRLQAARSYTTRDEIVSAAGDFGSWRDLCDAGFPTKGSPPDAHLRLVSQGDVPSIGDTDPGEPEPPDQDDPAGKVVDEHGATIQLVIVLSHPDLDRPVKIEGHLTVRQYRAKVAEWIEMHRSYGDVVARACLAVALLADAAAGNEDMTVSDAADRLRKLGGGSGLPPLPPAA